MAIYVYGLADYLGEEPWEKPRWDFAQWDYALAKIHPELEVVRPSHDALLASLLDTELLPILDQHLDVRSLVDGVARTRRPGMLIFVGDDEGAKAAVETIRIEAMNEEGWSKEATLIELARAEHVMQVALAKRQVARGR
jgi:hypothetical protein